VRGQDPSPDGFKLCLKISSAAVAMWSAVILDSTFSADGIMCITLVSDYVTVFLGASIYPEIGWVSDD